MKRITLSLLLFCLIALVGQGTDPIGASPQGATYFVDGATGSDSNTCAQAQSEGTPKATVRAACQCITAGVGGTVRVKPGTYSENLSSSHLRAGADWNNPTIIEAYDSGNKPVLQPGAVTQVLNLSSSTLSYIEFKDLVLDAVNVTNDVVKITNGAHHIRLRGCELKNAPGHGVITSGTGSGNNEFIDCVVHDNGDDSSRDHNFYIQTGNNLIQGCEIYPGLATTGAGISIRGADADNNVVDSCTVYDHGECIKPDSSDGIIIKNCIVYNCSGVGIHAKNGQSAPENLKNLKIYNNSLYGNFSGIRLDDCETCEVRNNAVTGASHVDGDFRWSACGGDDTVSNNIFGYTWSGCTSIPGNYIGVDPLWTDPGAGDFTLQSGSPAINNGFDTSAVVTEDFAGASRPQGAAVDIGAYEFGGTPTNQAPIIDAGPNKSVTGTGNSVALAGSASDDGLPNPPATLYVKLTKAAGPGTLTFGDDTSPTSTVSADTAGSYTIQYYGCDDWNGSSCDGASATDTMTLTVTEEAQPTQGRKGWLKRFLSAVRGVFF